MYSSELSGPSAIHVAFFTSCLGGGGAEKHLVRVANHLPRTIFRVSVIAARGGGSYEAELAPDIQLVILGARRMLTAPLKLRSRLRALQPDVVCSVLDHANCAALLAISGMRSAPPVVACVQIPPSIEHRRNPSLTQRALLRAIPLLYRRAARIIALSDGVKHDLESLAANQMSDISVIPNAAVDAAVLSTKHDAPVKRKGSRPVIAACGRLTLQKDYPTLIAAVAMLRQRLDAELWIIGDGPLRQDLETEVARLGLSDAVWFAGFQSPPYPLMRQADVFVLSSRWEGFGNVIAEAMALGVPVVSTDCPYGPAEIITTGRNGILVPPAAPDALANAIQVILTTPTLHRDLATAGIERAQDFTAERIAARYGRLLSDVVSSHGRRSLSSDAA